MRVVLRAGNPFELSRRHQLAHEDVAPALDTLPAVVGELHLLFVESHAVAENGEYGARSQDVGIEALLFERVVLRQPGLVHQIHGFLHRVTDVFVVRGQREKVVVDFLYIMI